MNLGVIIVFALLHLVLSGGTVLATWVGGGESMTFAESLEETPLKRLVGEDSTFGKGSLDQFTFEAAGNLIFGPVRTFYGLFSFEYDFLDSDGVVGIIGTLLSTAGHLMAGWLIFQVGRAGIGGFLSFLGR